MKRKIEFELTIGSHWPNQSASSPQIPTGGTPEIKIIEFETNNKNPFDDACKALAKEMKGKTYHIWYWTWLD